MKKLLLVVALAPLTAFAVTTYDMARVESVTPQVEQVRSQGQCRTYANPEQRYQNNSSSQNSGVGGTLIGGLVGGLLGNQVGGGNGKTVATVAGALAGGYVGGNVDRNGTLTGEGYNNNQPAQTTREVCDADRYTSRTVGYMVDYVYKGERGSVLMNTNPGRTIQMQVTAVPVVR